MLCACAARDISVLHWSSINNTCPAFSPLQRSCWSDERLGSWTRLNSRLCLTRLRERAKSEWKTKWEEEARDWKEALGWNRKGWMPASIGSGSSQVPQTWPPTSTTSSSRATSGCGAGSWGWVSEKCRIDKWASDWYIYIFFSSQFLENFFVATWKWSWSYRSVHILCKCMMVQWCSALRGALLCWSEMLINEKVLLEWIGTYSIQYNSMTVNMMLLLCNSFIF